MAESLTAHPASTSLVATLWSGIGGPPALITRLTDPSPRPTGALPSSFAIEAFGAAAFACVGLAIAELTGAVTVRVDGAGVAEALRSEQSLRIGDEPPEAVWDPLSRTFSARDGWVRLHANYPAHRAAIHEVFGTTDPAGVASAIAKRPADEIERSVYAAGGVAAAARTLAQWKEHPHGRAVGVGALVDTTTRSDRARLLPSNTLLRQPGGDLGRPALDSMANAAAARPLAGLRVLELTRVIAGPVAGRTLTWFGADVLRVESQTHDEIRTLIADTGPDKRSTLLDLKSPAGLDRFEHLLGGADVFLHGLRPGALVDRGLDQPARAARAPGLIDASLSAYGPGPWHGRRGFDSLMQLNSGLGLAEAHAAGTPADGPRALPCQLLDHATGLLLAAAIIRAVHARRADGAGRTVTASLARTAAELATAPRAASAPPAPPAPARPGALVLEGPLGRTRHVPLPIAVDGVHAGWRRGASLPGTDAPTWNPTSP